MTVHLAHVWSSHFGVSLGLPLIEPFVKRGWRVTVLCPNGDSMAQVKAAGIEHVPIDISRRLLDPTRDLPSLARLAVECRRQRFDIVHTHNVKIGWLGRITARLAGSRRVVHTVHGAAFGDDASWLAHLAEASAERTASHFCDRILVQSNDDARSLTRAGIPPHKLVFLGNGVSLVRFDPSSADRARVRHELALDDDDVLFVSAGRLVHEKGFTDLAKAAALARLTNPHIRVAIAGPIDPQSRQALSASECDELGQHVQLLGQRDDMPDVLAAADVVVLASHHEGLPRILMEGAAMAKPLLTTTARGCRELVNDRRSGALVSVGATDQLSQAILALAADPAGREKMGSFNRNMAITRFDIRAVLTRLEGVYGELLG